MTRSRWAAAGAVCAAILVGVNWKPRVLRVCSDPNNLPFSNERGEGFENRIASLLADELRARLEYTWRAQRRGFFRETLQAGRCDVVMGVPVGLDMVLATKPYYRSSYVFVTRAGEGRQIRSFEDPRLKQWTIGVHLVGDDGANPPALQSLAARGIVENVEGYPVYGNYAEPDPPSRLMAAVAKGTVDVAVVWGPLAGFFGRRQSVPLRIDPVTSDPKLPGLPFAFEIAMGVRKGEREWKAELDGILLSRRKEIDAVLDSYGVPRR